MADKFTEFAGRMGNAPKGVGTGLKLLVAAAAAAYGIKESIYTGIILYSLLRSESQDIDHRYGVPIGKDSIYKSYLDLAHLQFVIY